jgi:hypothetical protein
VSRLTARPADREQILANLRRLHQIAALPTDIKRAAQNAEDAFRSGVIPAINVMQHSDLWTGNVLKAPSRPGFIVIDWASARLDGAPFFDLIKFALSVRWSRRMGRKEIAETSQILGCEPKHALPYVLSGLGALHAELEHFPEQSFIRLGEEKVRAMGLLGFNS